VLCLCSISTQNATNSFSDDQSDTYFPAVDGWSDTFDWKLLKTFSTPQYRNVLISPIGLKLILALLYEGSGGITEKEFQNVLQFPVQKQVNRENFQKIIEALLQPSEKEEYILNLGTRIFLDARVTPQQNFAAKAAHNYKTDIQATNFSEPDEASQTINSWIDKLTHGKVSHLISPGDLEDAIMIIANAIYFKGTWRHQFLKNETALGGFYVSPNEIITVPYMTTTDAFYYFESNDLDAKILRLPYKGNKYGLFILLPNSKGGLPELIKKVSLTAVKKQLYMLEKVPVKVRLPKFKFNFQARFTQTLQEFGLRQMFQNTASFPGIARGLPNLLRMLVVSDIIQKSGIEVDEEGSVVYATSEVQVGNKFGEVDYVFNATHPFLFFLEEQTSGTILFVGRVENPLESNSVPLPPRFGDNQPTAATSVVMGSEFSESPGNIFISPASIKTTLALILEGAKGKNAEEIGNALRIDNIDQKEIREILHRLLFDLNDRSPNTVLEAGNSIFISDKYRVIPEYEKKVATYYNASIRNLDFSRPNEAAKVINSWVYETTHGLIKQIVGNQNLFADTTLVIANALFFKGKWKIAFDPKSTKEKCFQSPTRNCVKIPMMQVTDTFNYNFNVDLNAHAIELPYQDDKYAMLILLPTNGNNVRTLARDMQHAQLNAILDGLKPNELILEIPRFEIEYSADLFRFQLKIQDIFGPNANLTGIVAQENIKINKIIHKTKVEVNEQGTRAAAATAAVVIPLMGTTTQRIVADHPFVFFIYHKESRNIIFEGIFVEPAQVPNPLKTVSPNQYYSQAQQRGGPNYLPYRYQ
ncbi:serpin B6, partial [Asbolus verrucosus]